jgi:SNF2 family DNA or RNA helicase
MRIVAENNYLTIYGPFPLAFLKVLSRVSGRKTWSQSKYVKIEGSPWNIKVLKDSEFDIQWEDVTNDLKEIEEIQHMVLRIPAEPLKHNYHPKYMLKEHQMEGLTISCYRKVFAYFLEMGLGKTALTIANFCILYMEDKINAVLILAPKGVHKQWIAEEIPKHIDPNIPLNMTLWTSGKYYLSEELKRIGSLNIFSLNIDSMGTEAGAFAIRQFINLFKGKVMMVVDESHQIGNYSSNRSKAAIDFGHLVEYRRILTGTPIATSLLNIWCQFMFLDSRIIGINYITAFKSRFIEEGGYSGHETVGSKNVEEFYSMIAPHCYRKTKKECLDLPDKIFATRYYQLGNETRWHYENIKNAFMTELKSGNIVEAKNGLAALIRLQQICSGFLPDENDEEGSKRVYEIFSYERAKIALDMVHQIEGQIIIWARFIPDIKSITHVFRQDYGKEILYHDQTDLFKQGKKKLLIMNQARGIGGNLQEGGCVNMIYYNNSYNLIHRLQSEDRVHRMGMFGALTIFDIMADKTVDKAIADNLKAKKNLASFALDDIRQMIED